LPVSREHTRLNVWPRKPVHARRAGRPAILPARARFLVGLAALSVGLIVAGIGLQLVPVRLPASAPPGWVVVLFGWGLVLPGAVVAFRTGLGRGNAADPTAGSAAGPQDWIEDETGTELRRLFYPTLFLVGYLVPIQLLIFGYAMPSSDRTGFWLALVVCCFLDLILLGYLVTLAHRGLRRLRYGAARIRTDKSGYRPGGGANLQFEGGAAFANCTLCAALRCVEQRTEHRCAGGKTTVRCQCYRVYEDAREVTADGVGAARASFCIPADLPGNRLEQPPLTYWELVVGLRRPVFGYEGVFLLPVVDSAQAETCGGGGA